MANSSELLINVVRSSKPKALRGLNQKVRGQVQGYLPSPAVAAEPSANRQSLTDRCAKKVTLFAEILLEIQDQMRCGRNLHCAAVSNPFSEWCCCLIQYQLPRRSFCRCLGESLDRSNSSPPAAANSRRRPPRGAFLILRPMAVDLYFTDPKPGEADANALCYLWSAAVPPQAAQV